MTAAPRREIDWEAIARDYRAGVLPIRHIARREGISETTIRKRAKEQRWERAAKIRERAPEKRVRGHRVREASPKRGTDDGKRIGSAAVLQSHQRLIRQALDVVESLIGELEEVTENRNEIDEATEMQSRPDAAGPRRASMLKALAQTSRELSQTLKNLVSLDRQAFGIEEGEGDGTQQPGHLVTIYIPDNLRETKTEPNSQNSELKDQNSSLSNRIEQQEAGNDGQ